MGNNNLISSKKTYYISIAILAGMFFIFGFVSWVNAILIPYFRISCELTHFESYFVAFAFYIAYFVMAIPSGVLLKKVGFKRGIMYGFMLTALGAFLFVPAALARQFEIFLAGLFSIGVLNVLARLDLYYGSAYSIHVDSSEGKGTTIETVIPRQCMRSDQEEIRENTDSGR